MNPEDRDPLLDAFLEEALGQTEPPDLSDRIVRAWSEQSETSESLHSEPAPPTPPPTPPPYQAATVQLDPKRAERRAAKSTWPRYVITLAVALAVLTIYIAASVNQADRLAEGDPERVPNPDGAVAQQSNDANNGAGDRDPNKTSPQVADRDGGKNGSAFDEPAPFERPERAPDNTNNLAASKPKALPTAEVITSVNDQLSDTWAVNKVEPAELATDEEYCRRVFLALIGRIPTVHELGAFLKRDDPNKRVWLVERLQDHRAYRPHYVANWTNFWTNLLIGRTGGQKDSFADREGLAVYISESLAARKPYDQMVHELITAQGANQPDSPRFNGAVNFLLDGYTPDTTLAASRTSRIFLGKQIQCVQCHNHPTNEGWSQSRFWEFNAFFRQMNVKPSENGRVVLSDRSLSSESRNSDEAEIYYEQLDGLKRVAYPVFFDGRAISKSGDIKRVNRRRELAKFVVGSREFSRAAVNRLWARFFQFGLANPIDDMGDHQAPEHPELLAMLAEQFEAHDYNLDHLIRWIISTDAFQRSSKAASDHLVDSPGQGAKPLFSRYYTRQLSPEAVYDSLLLAANVHKRESSGTRTVGDYVKAQQAWVGEFTKNMKTDEGQETDTFSGDIRQSVVVMTSPLMKRAVSNQLGGVLHQVTTSSMPIPDKIEHLFLAALSRKPTVKEMRAVRQIVDPRDPAAGLQDIWWALLNSNEFILDH